MYGTTLHIMKMNQVKLQQQKVFFVGEFQHPMTPQAGKEKLSTASRPPIEDIFTNKVAYDGRSTDAPMFLYGESIKHLDPQIKEGILQSYNNLNPIVLLHAGEAEINALLGIVGLDQDYKAPDNMARTEIFAIDRAEGLNFRFISYPDVQDDPRIQLLDLEETETNVREDLFLKWFSNRGNRITEKIKDERAEAKESLAARSGTGSADMEAYVKGFNSVFVFPGVGRNTYQFSFWIFALHDLSEEADWFYVRQEGQLFSGGGYWPRKKKDWTGSGYDIEEYYIFKYTMNNQMDGLKQPSVEMFRSSPSTETTKTEVTSGVNWDFTGDLGFEGTKPKGNVGAKLSLKHENKVTLQDCQVFNNSLDAGSNAKWLYQFKEVKKHIYFLYVGFDHATPLQRGLFQPINQWLWRFAPQVRAGEKYRHFRSTFGWDRVSSQGKDIAAYWLSTAKHTHQSFEKTFYVPLPYPPVLMVDRNVSVDKKGQSLPLDIATGRGWGATCDQSWCRIDPPKGTTKNPRINITVDENTTGENRKAKITFRTFDMMGYATTEVFQSKY